MWRRLDLMVSALDSGNPGRGTVHCVLGKTVYSQSASFYPDVKMITGEFNAGGSPTMDWYPIKTIKGEEEIFLVHSYYKYRNMLRPDGLLGSWCINELTESVIIQVTRIDL